MTYRCLLQMVLLLCLSTTALCRSYSLLRFQQGRSLEVCQNLLWQLPSTPQHCLEFRMDFQMPEEMKQAQQFRKEDAVLVMYEMLQHIFNILTRDFSSTGWSETIIEHLREELYGQMNRLEPIQKEIMQKQTSTMGDTTDLHLRKYYFTLGQYLKSKEHNSSALGRMTRMPVIVLSIIDYLKETSKLIPKGTAYRKISTVWTVYFCFLTTQRRQGKNNQAIPCKYLRMTEEKLKKDSRFRYKTPAYTCSSLSSKALISEKDRL
ncbi:hypothetical protein JEQ12_009218 [Ovis aries]|uniref:Antiluteolysin n=1 Tax=Ovis aries TaxID=9940 RepID=A0A836ALL6_SHEEP|nr:hypothetical protein JEQ12_009218 [Ovis aries]